MKGRLAWLTLASFFFYGWWDWRFLFLIIFSGLVDYLAALGMQRYSRHRRFLLIVSIFANVGSLSFFKYSGFIATNIDLLFGLSGSMALSNHINNFFLITPVGISFYTFQSMSYTFDVYKRKLEPTKNILHFFAYLSMFPQLVAGPIVRAKEMLPQLLQSRPVSNSEQWEGFRLIVKGYFKKMVIADNLAPLVVAAFSSPEISGSSLYWWGVIIAFAFQIYCDFAGYSDIARGLAKWMGYDFPDNFNHPYISASLREFWTRWHISLSTWFRDYLYFPLGGNKKGKFRHHLNMLITMVVSGLWHGAAWTYVAWGAIHAFFLLVERITGLAKWSGKNAATKITGWILVTLQVLVAWVFFRANNINQAWEIIKTMFSFRGEPTLGWGFSGTIFVGLMIVWEAFIGLRLNNKFKNIHPLVEMAFYALIIAVIIFFRGEGSEFIYFQF
ncbi:MAG: MBOAT family protein [Prolixibacteraceae bacterium]|nr:MBOAT family protein [Prolixibacteraceae bacterium]